jgi:hypothetical protein
MAKKRRRKAHNPAEPGVPVVGLRCETCDLYIRGQKRIYPNCDNEALGWVTCLGGSTIRRDSMGCGKHTGRVQTAERVRPDDAPATAARIRA